MSAATYYTGIPCKRGHLATRYVKGGACTECTRDVCSVWRKRNRGKRKGYNAKWVAENPEKERAMRAEYRKANKTTESRRTKAWSVANRERKRALDANWTKSNPIANSARTQRRRARKASAPGRGVSPREWREVLNSSAGLCIYCSEPASLTVDHIEPIALGGAHDVENIAPACKACNSSKGDTRLLIWLARRAQSH